MGRGRKLKKMEWAQHCKAGQTPKSPVCISRNSCLLPFPQEQQSPLPSGPSCFPPPAIFNWYQFNWYLGKWKGAPAPNEQECLSNWLTVLTLINGFYWVSFLGGRGWSRGKKDSPQSSVNNRILFWNVAFSHFNSILLFSSCKRGRKSPDFQAHTPPPPAAAKKQGCDLVNSLFFNASWSPTALFTFTSVSVKAVLWKM